MKRKLLLWLFLIFCTQAVLDSAHGAINISENIGENSEITKPLQQKQLQGSFPISCLNGQAHEVDGAGRKEGYGGVGQPEDKLPNDLQRRGGAAKAVPSSSGDSILRRPHGAGHSGASSLRPFPSLSIFMNSMVQFSFGLLLSLPMIV